MAVAVEEYVDENEKNYFRAWLDSLDKPVRARIQARILRLHHGNFGDVKYFDGIGELRFDFGSGYRVYFAKDGETLILLLTGGDKSSQNKDIQRAKHFFDDYKRK